MSRTVGRWLAATSVVAAMGLAACGDDDTSEVRTVTVPAAASTSEQPTAAAQEPVVDGDAILIRTRITDGRKHVGRVLDGSVIGESAFCPGGTTSGGGAVPIVVTFRCPDGRLTVKFAITRPGSVQGAVWEVVRGTGGYEGLRGGGSMVAQFPDDDPDKGRETFAGTVGE